MCFICALVAHRHSFAPPRCRTSQYHRTFVPLSVSFWNDLSKPVFDTVGLAGFKGRANAVLLSGSALYFLSPTILSVYFYFFLPWCGVEIFGLIECSHSFPTLHYGLQLIIIKIIILNVSEICRRVP